MSGPEGTEADSHGMSKLESELRSFPASSVTHRVLSVMRAVLPGDPVLPIYADLDEAANAVFGGIPADLREEARKLCDDPRVDRALFAARSIDTGDTGLTIVSGVRSALALFFAKGTGRSEALAQQQRTDAALKALALAYIVTRLVPLPPAERIEVLRSVPAGRQLITYYGAVDIAVPLRDEVAAGNGTFVADLVKSQGRSLGDRLLAVVGRSGLADAEEMLAGLLGELDKAALAAVPHATSLAEQIRSLLPVPARTGDLFDLVAAGADALPCYRYLVARLAIELSLAVAKHRAMPEVPLPDSPAIAAPVPVPPPPPVPAELRTDAPPPPAAPPGAEVPAPPPSAPPPAPAPYAWPTAPLPEAKRLRGMFGRDLASATPAWRVFTVEGVYTERPPAVPDGVDWDAHRAEGAPTGTYTRDGEAVTITLPDGSTRGLAAVRDPAGTGIALDGERWPRADWDLTGRGFDGAWVGPGGATFTARPDGTGTFGGEPCVYRLGVGRITLVSAGEERVLTLLTDLSPSSRQPARLWIGGRPFDRSP